MLNFLYLAFLAVCVAAGALGYPIWTIIILAFPALWLFYSWNNQALAAGLRENGLSYFGLMVAGNALLCAVPFFIGRLIGWALQ